MDIRINTDNYVNNTAEFSDELSSSLSQKLEKFKEHITTVEVHLSDENHIKGGADDKRCLIEARLQGMDPIASSAKGETLREAFASATKKIERIVGDAIARRRGH